MKNWGYFELTEYIRNEFYNYKAEENYSDGTAVVRVLNEEEMYTIAEGVVEAWIVYITIGELLTFINDCSYDTYINIIKVVNTYDKNIALNELQPSEEANFTERILKVKKAIKAIKFTCANYLNLNDSLKELLLVLINEDCNIDKSIERIVTEHFVTESMDRIVVDWSFWITIGEILTLKGSCSSEEYHKVMKVVNSFNKKLALSKLHNDKSLILNSILPEDVVNELAERVKTVKEQFKDITVIS